MNWDALTDRVADWLDTRDLLTPEARWAVGVSGGPDSVLLLRALHDVSRQRDLRWALHVAHLHHGLRGDAADADAELVGTLAEQLGVRLYAECVDTGTAVKQRGGSVEEVARQLRYELLERVALQTGSTLVAVGHHADDNAETVLHRICRGTGLRGLAGMPEIRAIQPGSRVRLVRPLLQQRRATIERLCTERGFETRIDASNQTDEFTRGRIRNIVLPLLREKLNPNVSEALLRLAEQARRHGEYLEDAAARTFESLLVTEGRGELVLNINTLLGKQPIIQAEIVRRAITQLLQGEQDLRFAHIEAVLQLAAQQQSGKELHLPGRLVVRKQYNRLEFHRTDEGGDEPAPHIALVPVACPGSTILPDLGAMLMTEMHDVDAGRLDELRANGPRGNEEWLDLERVQLPLMVRGRREGDRFHPLGAPGSKSLSDFFIDEKIEPAVRSQTGILCDQDGPIWVMPLRIDERVKLRPDTRRALRLVLNAAPANQARTS